MSRTEASPRARDGGAAGTAAEIGRALQAVGRVVMRERGHALLTERAGVRIDRAGAALLSKLMREEGLRLGDLAHGLDVDATAVTRKVQQLEQQGLVERSRDETDHRAFRLRLTRSGRRVIDRLTTAREGWLNEILADWSEADRVAFAALLHRFADDIAAHGAADRIEEQGVDGTQ